MWIPSLGLQETDAKEASTAFSIAVIEMNLIRPDPTRDFSVVFLTVDFLIESGSTVQGVPRSSAIPKQSLFCSIVLPFEGYIYGASGPGTQRGLHIVADYIATRTGNSPVHERLRLGTILTSLVLQYTALSVNRRRIRLDPLA